jgi:hypothetical protein
VQAWQAQLSNAVDTLFSDKLNGLTALTQLINNGLMLSTVSDSLETLTQEVEKTLYGLLIPQAWAAKNLQPFIL